MDSDADPPNLPAELWLISLEFLRSEPGEKAFSVTGVEDRPPKSGTTLKALSQTSRWFRNLAEPLLHEWLTLSGYEREFSKTAELVKRIRASDALQQAVKYLIIRGFSTKNAEKMEVTKNLFKLFTNVRGVRLSDTHLPFEAVSDIINFPSLRIWESECLRIKGGVTKVKFDPETLHLTHFRFRTDIFQTTRHYY